MNSPDQSALQALTLDHVKAAAQRIEGAVVRTPTMHSITLSQITGAEIWLKFENLQFTAAYKERGALNALLLLDQEQRKRGVIAASAGNHSQGLSYHGRRLGVPVTIVMPRPTPVVKVMQTESVGGEVVLEGETFDEAYAKVDWSAYARYPAFAQANRINAYGTFLLMERESLQQK